jgi:LPPG:FO 2-phospho-L-lactate transferase
MVIVNQKEQDFSMKVLALAGGVGGAKLVDGISRLPSPPELTVVVNTGDDFYLFGLKICPDLDTVCYNLAGIENPESGWGRAAESWTTLDEVSVLNGPVWFRLGNKDLATHLERTRRLTFGDKLSEITRDFCSYWGISTRVLPMTDDLVPTIVKTDQGDLSFQDYFVKKGAGPKVSGFEFQNVEHSRPAPGVLPAISEADVILICPSNPWLSINPILEIPGIRSALEEKIVLAVSPIIEGEAVKGPAAKIYREMGISPSAASVADHYQEIITGMVFDTKDQELADKMTAERDLKYRIFCTDTIMNDREDRIRVATNILEFAREFLKED